jgi:STE24 endopeptidase
MHFVVIAAFALVLTAREPTKSWWLFKSIPMTYAVVGGQIAVILLLTLVFSIWVIRRLSRQPWNPDYAQRLFSKTNVVLRGLLLASLAVDVLMTPWLNVVRLHWHLRNLVAIDDLVVMMPFFLGTILSWAVQFPAEKAIRRVACEQAVAGQATGRSMWRLGEYLIFNIRHQLLLIVVPMAGILVAYDLSAKYSMQLWRKTHLEYAEQVALMLAAGGMFVISPVILRYVWSTAVLPSDGLRARLQSICDHIRLRYREILVWKSDGVVVNAAVMGLIAPMRYILLSDGLLETMNEKQVEAVFGHEAGHVKHHHIHYYLLFAALSMLTVGGILWLVWEYLPYARAQRWFHVSRSDWNNILDLAAMVLVLLCWIVGFGWVSRRFERQADVFGVRCVGWNIHECGPDCQVHNPPAGKAPHRNALCPQAADIFAEALHRIAILNGIAPHARSWRHSSIASRMDFVRLLARDPGQVRKFNRTVFLCKAILVLGTATGCAIGAYLYWPAEFFHYWFHK